MKPFANDVLTYNAKIDGPPDDVAQTIEAEPLADLADDAAASSSGGMVRHRAPNIEYPQPTRPMASARPQASASRNSVNFNDPVWNRLPEKLKHIATSLSQGKTKPELVKLCKSKQLMSSGTKTEIAIRLAQHASNS